MSISLFTDAMGYDKVLTNFDNIKQMSIEKFAQFMFDYGADCCDCCKYKDNCCKYKGKCGDGNSCEYNDTTTDVEIIKEWLESRYD